MYTRQPGVNDCGEWWSVVGEVVREQHDSDRSCRAGGVVQDGDRRVCWGQDREYDKRAGEMVWHSVLLFTGSDLR